MPLPRVRDTYPAAAASRRTGSDIWAGPHNTTIIVSRWAANTAWTQRLATKGYRVLVYEHGTNPNSPYNLHANVGREASAYLRYLTDFYDTLTPYTIFVHDEEHAWHHDGSLVDIIATELPKLTHPKYVNFNNRCTGSVHNDLWPDMRLFFDKYLARHIGKRSLYGDWTLGNRCCAQFLVHRDRILRHPRSFYQALYKFFTQDDAGDRRFTMGVRDPRRGHLLEWTVALIFNSPVLYPSASSATAAASDQHCPQPSQTRIRSTRA